jgi:cation:H+ antiporter
VTALLFIAALVLLVVGGEVLVRGAARLATGVGVTPLVIGLTVVAFGTSAPELAVSLRAAFAGQSDLAVGNVVGSNIFNVLFILGVSAIIVPLAVSEQLVRIDIPVMVGVSAIVMLFGLNGHIGRIEAGCLALLLVAYLWLQFHLSRRAPPPAAAQPETSQPETSPPEATGHVLVNLLLIVAGLALLTLGSTWLVRSATAIATAFGVTHLVIGLTIVAAGTSLPEVVTSIVAGLRGQRDIAIGNVIGSNIFNLLAVLGFTGVIAPAGLAVPASALSMDIPVMLAVAVLCLPIFIGYSINRWEGILFLGYYALYATYLFLQASRHDALLQYRGFIFVVLPLTLITLLSMRAYARRTRRRGNPPFAS